MNEKRVFGTATADSTPVPGEKDLHSVPVQVGLKEIEVPSDAEVRDEVRVKLAAAATEIENFKRDLAAISAFNDSLIDGLNAIRATGAELVRHLDDNCTAQTVHHHMRGWEFQTSIPDAQRENLKKLRELLTPKA